MIGREERYEDDEETFLATQLNWIKGAGEKRLKLPPGACFWQQGSLIKGIPTGPSEPNCTFQVGNAIFVPVLQVRESKPMSSPYLGIDRMWTIKACDCHFLFDTVVDLN